MKTRHKLTTELFIEPYEDQYLFYAPLKQIAFLGNSSTARILNGEMFDKFPKRQHDLYSHLRSIGLIDADSVILKPKTILHDYKPTRAYILPTTACEFRCIYCFSKGGDKNISLDFKIAKATVDYIIQNSIEHGYSPRITFHGGGEPTLNWDLIKDASLYFQNEAKKYLLEPRISLVTNGFLTEEKINWIVKNISSITVSFDGPENIQNFQRPLANVADSFSHVVNTFNRLKAKGMRFGVRSTITEYNVNYLTKIVEMFVDFDVKSIHFEPLTQVGRSLETNVKGPDAESFIKNFKEAYMVAKKNHIKLRYSGLKNNKIGIYFCGASGRNFFVTPEGNVTTCHHPISSSDPASKIYYIGHYIEETNNFYLDEKKIKELSELSVLNSPACQKCFCKWSCSGGCFEQNRTDTGELLLNKRTDRCHITRELTKLLIVDQILEANKNN